MPEARSAHAAGRVAGYQVLASPHRGLNRQRTTPSAGSSYGGCREDRRRARPGPAEGAYSVSAPQTCAADDRG